jgi:hypothetical protein
VSGTWPPARRNQQIWAAPRGCVRPPPPPDATADTAPAAPSAAAIQRLRDNLAAVLTNGTPGQRKAIIETHVAEIKIEGNQLIPIFKIPLGDDEGPTDTVDP